MKVNFLVEFNRLILDYPVPEYFGHSNENASGDYIYHNDKTFSCFDAGTINISAYIWDSLHISDSVEVSFGRECEKCYMCDQVYKCNNCDYVFNSRGMLNCQYCFNCGNLQDCFGCVGIWNSQYVLFNRQMKKGEYLQEIKKLKEVPGDELLSRLKKLAQKIPLPPTNGAGNSDSNTEYGDDIHRSQNVYMAFSVTDSQNVLYATDSNYCVDSVDLSNCYKCDSSYNCVDTGRAYNSIAIYFGYRLVNCAYCYYCQNCQDCLGCVGLEGKRYCVLNRQVGKKVYQKVLTQILKNPNAIIDLKV